VAGYELDQVCRRLAGEDARDDVAVRGVARWLALPDPHAGRRAEDGGLALVLERLRGVAARRAAAQHELAERAEADRRQAVRVPPDLRAGLAPALGHSLPDRVDLPPRTRVLGIEPCAVGGAGQHGIEPE